MRRMWEAMNEGNMEDDNAVSEDADSEWIVKGHEVDYGHDILFDMYVK